MGRHRTVKIGSDGSLPDPRWKGGPDDDELPLRDCPTCGAVDAANVEADSDEDGPCLNVKSCDTCATACECGEVDFDKSKGPKCAACVSEEV